jgi:hypothetical protein
VKWYWGRRAAKKSSQRAYDYTDRNRRRGGHWGPPAVQRTARRGHPRPMYAANTHDTDYLCHRITETGSSLSTTNICQTQPATRRQTQIQKARPRHPLQHPIPSTPTPPPPVAQPPRLSINLVEAPLPSGSLLPRPGHPVPRMRPEVAPTRLGVASSTAGTSSVTPQKSDKGWVFWPFSSWWPGKAK